MKNLKNFDVIELSVNEIQEIDGGNYAYWFGKACAYTLAFAAGGSAGLTAIQIYDTYN